MDAWGSFESSERKSRILHVSAFFFEEGISNFTCASNGSLTAQKVRDCSLIPQIYFAPKLFTLKNLPLPIFISEKLLKCCWNSVVDICGPFTWIYWLLIFFLFCFLSLPLSLCTHTHTFILHYSGVICRHHDPSYKYFSMTIKEPRHSLASLLYHYHSQEVEHWYKIIIIIHSPFSKVPDCPNYVFYNLFPLGYNQGNHTFLSSP